MGCISLTFGLTPNNSTDEHQRVGRVVERRKSEKEVVGQEKRVKSEERKMTLALSLSFGYVHVQDLSESVLIRLGFCFLHFLC